MTIERTLQERASRYGDFLGHSDLAIVLKEGMRSSPGWVNLRALHMQALDTIMDKVARIINGDPDYVDNWHDIQGYAKLVEDRIPKAWDLMESR